MRCFVLLCLVAGCTASQARIVRDLGIGVTAEGAGLAAAATVTRDPADGVRDVAVFSAPLVVPGLAMWLGGQLALAVHE